MSSDKKQYYLGLDIGTDSVGYAATNEAYDLLKYCGEPVWGVQTFEAASLAEERRMNRTARRRLDRRQQRVQLLSEIFAPEICRIDPNFFIRRKESALFKEDTQYGVHLFEGGISDKQFHKEYPTIHHLIVDLMNTDKPKDIRLVYLACAWLVGNRGHFLFAADSGSVDDFAVPYQEFVNVCRNEFECELPWSDAVSSDAVLDVMQAELGVTKKTALFVEKIYGGEKPAKRMDEGFPFRKDLIVTLIAGGKVSPKDLFAKEEYGELSSFSLGMDDESFEVLLADLGEDAALLRALRKMYDCALLKKTLRGARYISNAKVEIYEQHAKDLKWLKHFLRKYKPEDYAKVFRRADAGNYVAYSYNVKNCAVPQSVKKANKTAFCDYLKKIVANVNVEPEDQEAYDDMISRLSLYSFMPKQKDTDNRVIPQQLYRCELAEILSRAKLYLPLLNETDTDGICNEQKILSVFDFRIPYYVGPLNPCSPHAWIERKAGKIYPWNFEQMVDLDASEQAFINRMTNSCTYLPGEDVLPYCSLLYSRFMVLNEINNLKINQQPIPVEVKQELYAELFEKGTKKKVTKKAICDYLRSRGYLNSTDNISGVDITLNSNLNSFHSFKKLLNAGILTEEQVEDIINHAAYSEDRLRMSRWLEREYPVLSVADRKYILNLRLKEFGRLSRKLLTGIYGCKAHGTGEAFTIMEALWQTNDNLMQLLSENYTFRERISDFAEQYYSDPQNKKSLSERLSDMYVSNAVKRQIIRSLDITADVVKAMHCHPQKIFVEMARGGAPEQKGKRTLSRKQQILDLYKKISYEDVPRLMKELEEMGETADNRLQSDRLFLYYMQLGKCMYSGKSIDLNTLSSTTYDIDHIYPQSKVKDDSILNNRILVLSSANGAKSDRYPVDASVRAEMDGFWNLLHKNGLITDEKYKRLTRQHGFSDEELHQFINRQLVETRQSTKVVAQLLKERYPDTEIVYVKAGMVSEFRQEFDMLKCRTVNDLHHAKDAYLNIVVGNVYHEKFTRRWFDTSQKYNISVKKTFDREQKPYGELIWRGEEDIAKVRKNIGKNAVHMTQYAFCRHHGQNGGFFDQNPVKAKAGLIALKEGLDTEKYGGYNGSTSTFFSLIGFTNGKKQEMMFFPVDLLYAQKFLSDSTFATAYVTKSLQEQKKKVSNISFPLGKRILKVNTLISLDDFLVCLASGSVKDGRVGFLPMTQFACSYEMERYIKRLERVVEKRKKSSEYVISAEYDGISSEKNIQLFDLYVEKLTSSVFAKRPGVAVETLAGKRDAFLSLPLEQQCDALLKIHMIFARQPNDIDLSDIGLGSHVFKARKSMYLSGWKKDYRDVRIIDQSASGLFVSQSENLLDLL